MLLVEIYLQLFHMAVEAGRGGWPSYLIVCIYLFLLLRINVVLEIYYSQKRSTRMVCISLGLVLPKYMV